MKRMRTRNVARGALSVLLGAMMVVSMLPAPALAEALEEAASMRETTPIEEVTPKEEAEPDSSAFEATQTVDGVCVAVKAEPGTFTGAELLVVERANATQEALAETAVEAKRDASANVAESYTFDVKVTDAEGTELQPADGKKVEVSFTLDEVADPNLSTSVYHIPDDGAAEELDVTTEVGDESTVTVEADGFSLYTVEFTYGELTYVMEGHTTIPLADVLAAIGLTGEPTAAETSNAALFSAEQDAAGAWQLTAHAPFSTTEWLRVTIKDVTYEIVVTDDPSFDVTNGPITINNDNKNDYNNKTITGTVEADSMDGDHFVRYSSVSHYGAIIIDGTEVNLTIKDLSITAIANNSLGAVTVSPIVLCNNATLSLTLEGNNSLTACLGGAGIRVPSGCTLKITTASTGSLTATGGNSGGTQGNKLMGGAGIGTEDTASGPENRVQNGTIIIGGGTITAQGGTTVSGSVDVGGAAGIGGSAYTDGGMVIINGGTVNATGGTYAAGIGGGAGGNAVVAISGGTINATAGSGTSGYVGAAIGCGYNSEGDGSNIVTHSEVSITGGNVTANGNIGHPNKGDYGADKLNLGEQAIINCSGEVTNSSATNHTIKVTVYDPNITTELNGQTATLTLDDGAPATGEAKVTQNGTATFSVQKVVSYGSEDTKTASASVTIGSWQSNATSSVTLSKSQKTNNIYWGYRLHVVGTVFDSSIVSGQTGPVSVGDWSIDNGAVTTTQGKATIDGWLIVAEGEGITDASDYTAPVSVTVGEKTFDIGDVTFTKTVSHQKTGSFTNGQDSTYYLDEDGESHTITDFIRLTDSTSTLEDGWYVVWPGEEITVSNRLSVSGTVNLVLGDGATLNANKGIAVNTGATLNVYSQDGNTGKLTATGANGGAGIGSNSEQNAGTINLYAGVIRATGNGGGAGIGGGKGATDHSYGKSGSITIDDRANIEAHGSEGAAGIGGGRDGDGERITISGGTVKAYGSHSTGGGAGIGGGGRSAGGGTGSYGGTIKINGTANVTAVGGELAAGIGSGSSTDAMYSGQGGNITIGGTANVTATGGKSGAGIGSGLHGIKSYITINGGSIHATGGNQAAGIGRGVTSNTISGEDGSIAISAGEVNAVGGQSGPGIGANGGKKLPFINITGGTVNATGTVSAAGTSAAGIGWGASEYRNTSDQIYINGGQVTANGINAYAGKIYLKWTNEETDYITCNGEYTGYAGITLYDDRPFEVQNSTEHTGEQATKNPINFNNATIVPMSIVKLAPGEGTGNTYSIPMKHGSNYTVPSCDFTAPTNKKFHHWEKSDDAEHQYMPGEVIENVSNSFTLTAIWWDANPITVESTVSDCISVSPELALENETVTIELTYGDSRTYTGGTLQATYTLNDQQQTLQLTQDPSNAKKYTFTMPAAPVSVKGEFPHVLAAYVDAQGVAQEPKTTFSNVNASTTRWEVTAENDGWYVVWEDTTISGDVSFKGNVNLILADGVTLTAEKGIEAGSNGSSLTIWCQQGGTGTLMATGTGGSPGIGGVNVGAYAITIQGGRVTATGGDNGGAGIGWGSGAYYVDSNTSIPDKGTITINGGVVHATGGEYAAGIGGRSNIPGISTPVGAVNINGGTVVAEAGLYTWNGSSHRYGAGIGTGGSRNAWEYNEYSINISGGTVTATGSTGIGQGNSGHGPCSITISGGAVQATGTNGAGIGQGVPDLNSSADSVVKGCTVKISGGSVNVAGSSTGIGVSKSEYDGYGVLQGCSITISGGTVHATGGDIGAGIGSGDGYKTDDTVVTLSYGDDKNVSITANKYQASSIKLEKEFRDASSTATFSVTDNQNAGAIANKTLIPSDASIYAVQVDSSITGGTVASSKGSTTANMLVTLTVLPATGFKLIPGSLQATYTENGETKSVELTQDAIDPTKYTFTMPAANVLATAQFTDHDHAFTYTADSATITATCSNADGKCDLPDHKATLTIAAPEAASLVYDGTAKAASVSGEIPGVATPIITYTKEGDSSFTGTPVGAGKYTASITVEGETASVTYTIAPAAITVSGITANTKTYDGTCATTFNTSSATLTGKLESDTLLVSATGTFRSAEVGTNKDVDITGLSLAGKDVDNYALALTNQQQSAKGVIKPRPVTITAKDQTVELNGTIASSPDDVTASYSGTGIGGLVQGHTINAVALSGDTTHAGSTYEISVGDVTIKDASGVSVTSNYAINRVSGKLTVNKGTPTITTAPTAKSGLSYTGQAQALVEEGATTGGTLKYAVGSQTAAPTDASEWNANVPTRTNAGTYYVWYRVDGGNDYEDIAADGPIEVGIAPVSLTVTAKPKSITYGDEPTNDGVQYSGFVNGETEETAGLTGSLDYEYSYTQYGDVGNSYTITPKGLTSSNYAITFEPGRLTVNPKHIDSITWSNTELTFTGEEQAPTATANGLVNGDELTVEVSGAKTNAGTGYSAAATGLTGTKSGNYVLDDNTTNRTTTFSIAQAAAPELDEVTLSLPYASTSATVPLTVNMPADAGELTFTVGDATKNGSVLVSDIAIATPETGAVLTATLANGALGDTITIPVTIASANYQDAATNVVITLTDKVDAGVGIVEGNTLTKTEGDANFTLHAKVDTPGANEMWDWESSNPATATVSSTGVVTIKTAGQATITASYSSDTSVGQATILLTVKQKALHVSYAAHTQTYGWNAPAGKDSSVAGTTGQGKRLEALSVKVSDGSIEYRSHVQRIGWESTWVRDGATSGTTGQGKRIEAIQMKLKGTNGFHVWYRVHSQTYGWLGWACDGDPAGTTGFAKRVEAYEVIVLPDGQKPDGYDAKRPAYVAAAKGNAHVQTFGWTGNKAAGTLGTTGQSKRIEAVRLSLSGLPWSGGIEYQAHVQKSGWMAYKHDGQLAGTTGQGRRIEAVRIRLTGEAAEHLSVWYRVHSQTYGWLGWTCDDSVAGTTGLAKRVEAIEIQILPKDTVPAGYNAGKTAAITR